jgi:hypothetical protein
MKLLSPTFAFAALPCTGAFATKVSCDGAPQSGLASR